ncbi:MAG: diacylglycerol kinase family protein [Sphaerochaeta sp.]
MPESELFVILNPHAGKGQARKLEEKVRFCLSRGERKVILMRTEEEHEAERLAWEATMDGRKSIIAAGGDGTVNEVINGMIKASLEMESTPPVLGVIPIGRGNDFAWGMGIPTDVEEACTIAFAGKTKMIDVGKVYGGKYPDGRYYVNGLGVGFEPLVNFIASDFKRLSGAPSYAVALLKLLAKYPKPYRVEITYDGRQRIVWTQQISVSNGRRMGSMFLMGPDALFDDGYFDVMWAKRPVSRRKVIPVIISFLKGTQLKRDDFKMVRTKKFSVVAKRGLLPIHVDGEEISRGCTEFSTEILEGILPVFV